MIKRALSQQLHYLLQHFPAVALLGPRQVGKTTLALEIAKTNEKEQPCIYLDLESPADRAKLTDPELYLANHRDKLVILDEVHRLPDLFQCLRGLIDKGRREGRKSSQFLLLGSASIDLLKQSSESLAGRIAYAELSPFNVLEINPEDVDTLWVRGGFPDSYLAADEKLSSTWRQFFTRSYLERDLPLFGPRIPAETLRRFWTMLAHTHGGLLNAATLARGLSVDGKTVAKYLDLMVDLLLVRRLTPWHGNIGKRLVKSPKVYVRDSGILHSLLELHNKEQLLGHPVVGNSWEGHVIENLLANAPQGTQASFYRTAAGAEIDLILQLPGNALWAIEIKRNLNPTPAKGFYHGCDDIKPGAKYVVYPGEERFQVSPGVTAIGLAELAKALAEIT